MPPVWIVSGYPRSGTSMMMRALMAGGLDGAFSDKRNGMAVARSDASYQPNPDNELFELEDWQYRQPGFPKGFESKLIKAVTMHARNLDALPGGCRVVFMRRDPEEIRQSFGAFFTERRTPTREQIEAETEWTLRQMRDRRSFCVVELDYRATIEDPALAFSRLANGGWPIDATKAAAEVRPELLRYRLEDLTIGVA